MIETLPDMPEGVIGIRVSGRLLGEDVREFTPAMQELFKTGEIGIVEVIASDALFGLDELERAKEWAAG